MVLLELFWSFVKIGFTSFGGTSMIPLIMDEMSSHGWMTDADLTNLIAIAEMTPGSLGVNAATFAGTKTAGMPGGVFAVCCDAADKEAAKKYTDRIRGMTVYTPEELSGFLAGAGLTGIECHSDPATGMVCMTGRKPAGSGSES